MCGVSVEICFLYNHVYFLMPSLSLLFLVLLYHLNYVASHVTTYPFIDSTSNLAGVYSVGIQVKSILLKDILSQLAIRNIYYEIFRNISSPLLHLKLMILHVKNFCQQNSNNNNSDKYMHGKNSLLKWFMRR